MTRLILIRHGETEWNARGLYQGQLDSPLTAEGRQQAQALARRLRRGAIDALYTSDLHRTQETAAPLARLRKLEVRPEPRLRERHYGIFQGLDKTKVEDLYPEEYAAHQAGDPDYQIPGGESQRQFHERVVACLEELAARHGCRQIVVVAHGGVVGAAIRHVLGISLRAPRRFALPNTSYNLFSFDAGGWMLHTLGDTSHLDADGRDDME